MNDFVKGQRPLVPRQSPPAQAPRPSSELKRPKKVSTACAACKRAKRKCSGTCPCNSCESQGVDCVFHEELDQRRKPSVRLKMEKSENYKLLLERLLKTIRSNDEDRVNHVLNVIKSNASLDEIASSVESSLNQPSSSGQPPAEHIFRELEALRSETKNLQSPDGASTSQRRVMTVEELIGSSRTANPSSSSSSRVRPRQRVYHGPSQISLPGSSRIIPGKT